MRETRESPTRGDCIPAAEGRTFRDPKQLSEDGKYRLQDVFNYKLADGSEGRRGIGQLEWMGIKSSFCDEPKIRVLRDTWNLTKDIFILDEEMDE